MKITNELKLVINVFVMERHGQYNFGQERNEVFWSEAGLHLKISTNILIYWSVGMKLLTYNFTLLIMNYLSVIGLNPVRKTMIIITFRNLYETN